MRSFFYRDRIIGHIGSGEDQISFVRDDPFDDLALIELHGLRDRRRKIDIPLLAAFSLDQLNFRRKSHKAIDLVI